MQEFPKTSENFRFSSKQELAILELLNPDNKTLGDIAVKVGVSERTIRTWLKTPHFQEYLEQERKRLRDDAFNRLKNTLGKAVEELGELLTDENSNVKLKACQAVLDFNLRVIEGERVEERIRKLEEAIEGEKAKR